MQHMSSTQPIMGAQFKQNPARNVKPLEVCPSGKALRYSEPPFSTGMRFHHADDIALSDFISTRPPGAPCGDTSLSVDKPVRALR